MHCWDGDVVDVEEGCEIEISRGREGVGGEGWGCSISVCNDKAESSGTSWEFCVSDVGVLCRVALWSAPEERASDG